MQITVLTLNSFEGVAKFVGASIKGPKLMLSWHCVSPCLGQTSIICTSSMINMSHAYLVVILRTISLVAGAIMVSPLNQLVIVRLLILNFILAPWLVL